MHQGRWRSGLLAFVWSYAALGILAQVLWFRVFSGIPGLLLYLGLGWVGVLSVVKLGREIGYVAVRPLWLAGIAYAGGAILEATRQPNLIRNWVGPHEVFHFAVVVGIALHWTFIRRLLLNHSPEIPAPAPSPAAVPSVIR